jgi:hypothetical protein
VHHQGAALTEGVAVAKHFWVFGSRVLNDPDCHLHRLQNRGNARQGSCPLHSSLAQIFGRGMFGDLLSKKMREKIDSTAGGTSCGDPMQGCNVGQYHVFLTKNFAFLGDY